MNCMHSKCTEIKRNGKKTILAHNKNSIKKLTFYKKKKKK